MVILDRGFISSKIVQSLYSLNFSFIIAFRKSENIRNACKLLEHPKTMKKGQFFVPQLNNTIYRVHSKYWVIKDCSYGNPIVKVNLVIWKIRKKKKKSKRSSDSN